MLKLIEPPIGKHPVDQHLDRADPLTSIIVGIC